MTTALTSDYSADELLGIYALGRLYFEMGYFDAATRVLSGLTVIDRGVTPAHLALGLIKLEQGQLEEASAVFRALLQSNRYIFEARFALAISCVAQGDLTRAKSLLQQVEKELRQLNGSSDPEQRKLLDAFLTRCS